MATLRPSGPELFLVEANTATPELNGFCVCKMTSEFSLETFQIKCQAGNICPLFTFHYNLTFNNYFNCYHYFQIITLNHNKYPV